MKAIRRLAVPLLVAFAATGWAADTLRMDARAAFDGPVEDTSTVTVTLENDGPDARGVLQVSGEGGPVSYPVELPRGARKRLLTMPNMQWGEIEFTLETDRGRVVRKLPAMHPQMEAAGGSIALVGDESGGLAFLRKTPDGQRSATTRDAYVKPEEAPTRAAAYQPFTSVVLGPGAERMTDETVAALKGYALGGGTVVFLGGASSPILEDPRWAPVLPGRGWKPTTLARSPYLETVGGAPIPGPFTILVPSQVAKGSIEHGDNRAFLESQVGYGLGSVVVLGYSPLEQPLSVWDGRAKAMTRFLRSGAFQRSRSFTASYLHSNQQQGMVYGGGPGAYATITPPGYPGSGVLDNPFSAKLPDTTAVFGILAVYFVLVVPVSFLVLRKMKRGELAWVTAPLLALGFAGALFKSAQGLYSAALSTASQGVLVLQQGAGDAMFYGTSQMFFPRGGTYDLKLENVDTLAGVQSDPYYGYNGGNAMEGFNLVDVGTMQAPALEANNLAFRDMSYTQRVEANEWFRFQRTGDGHMKVENRSPYPFQGAIVDGECRGKDFSLAPGAAASVELGTGDVAPKGSQLAVNDARNFTRQDGRIALSGTLAGFRPGPQIGKEVENRAGIAVLAFAQERLP